MTGSTPKLTTSAEELCASSLVDAVMICSVNAYHPFHTILALKHDKHVFVEKPVALCYRDIESIEAAEQQSKCKVFVGYMRRYAPALSQAVAEVGGRTLVQYVRVRDIIGLNSDFVAQSGTFPKRFSDISSEDRHKHAALEDDICEQALVKEFGLPLNTETKYMLGLLGTLGTHDLSAMREVIGVPRSVTGADLRWPIWAVLFRYDGFPVLYESGINSVPDFDAHIEIYTESKIVRIKYETPFIKGLPITTTIRERIEGPNGESSFRESCTRITYEDPYTIECKLWHDCIVNGAEIKTSIADAREDVKLFEMIMQSGFGKGQGMTQSNAAMATDSFHKA